MDPRHLFMDDRLTGMCVYCGAQPDTRDHVPSKVLLDEPYPPQLPVVGACRKCNETISLDEEYLACFLECVLCGTTEPSGIQRPIIKRILNETPALKARIEASQKRDDAGNLLWEPEINRVRNIVMKLSRGHAAYELYPNLFLNFKEPIKIAFSPLPVLDDQEKAAFENVTSVKLDLLPETGTRAFFRACGEKPDRCEQKKGWVVVQPGRYRYSVLETEGVLVRIILSEYLACEVVWQ